MRVPRSKPDPRAHAVCSCLYEHVPLPEGSFELWVSRNLCCSRVPILLVRSMYDLGPHGVHQVVTDEPVLREISRAGPARVAIRGQGADSPAACPDSLWEVSFPGFVSCALCRLCRRPTPCGEPPICLAGPILSRACLVAYPGAASAGRAASGDDSSTRGVQRGLAVLPICIWSEFVVQRCLLLDVSLKQVQPGSRRICVELFGGRAYLPSAGR